jgi:hypothetical protein
MAKLSILSKESNTTRLINDANESITKYCNFLSSEDSVLRLEQIEADKPEYYMYMSDSGVLLSLKNLKKVGIEPEDWLNKNTNLFKVMVNELDGTHFRAICNHIFINESFTYGYILCSNVFEY